jgi:hypothetical protein
MKVNGLFSIKNIFFLLCTFKVSVIFAVNFSNEPATLNCIIEAANRQQIPANILLAISSIESGKNGQSVRNRNGSVDLGHFQINTIHWNQNGALAKLGVKREDVQWRGCYNAEIAAYLLRLVINENTNQDYWTKVANYHSKNPSANNRYRAKLIPLASDWAKFLTNQYQSVQTVYY